MDAGVVDKPHDAVTMAAWLKTQLVLEPSERIRVQPVVLPDRRAHPGQDVGTEVLEAWGNGAWWYSRMGVEIYAALFPTGKAARWLLLGSAHIPGIVEGTRPGQPFVNCWEDQLSTWRDLVRAAAGEAEETLETLGEVSVGWRSGHESSSPRTSSGS